MARFRFRLQSVLNIKARLEEQQKLNFAAARKKLSEEEEKLRALYVRKEEYEQKGRRMRNEVLNVTEILENETAIVRIKEFIDDQTATVRLCEKKLEEERIKLVEAMKERKTYEKLRENALEAFLKEELKKEGVENDEHNSFVYGQREMTGNTD